MKNHTASLGKLAMSALLLWACQNGREDKRTSGAFAQQDFGDLPPLPGGKRLAATEDAFLSLLADNSAMKLGSVLTAGFMMVGSDGGDVTCPLNIGTTVYLVAKVKDDGGNKYYLVQLPKPCKTQAGQVGEGYIIEIAIRELEISRQSQDAVTNSTDSASTSGEGCKEITQTVISTPVAKEEYDANSSTRWYTANPTSCSAPTAKADGARAFGSGGAPEANPVNCNMPGQLFRNRGIWYALGTNQAATKNELAFTIKSTGAKTADITVTRDEYLNAGILAKADVKADQGKEFTKAGVALDASGTSTIKLSDLVPVNAWFSTTVKIAVKPNGEGDAKLASCTHEFRIVSPIVIDLGTADAPALVAAQASPVTFDLDANDTAEKTGWIASGTGLLAVDWNGDGKITSGAELFGEYTLFPAREAKFANGYEALKMFDDNSDGFLTSGDRIFGKIVVWFDTNGDGQSQKSELKTLSSLGITSLGLDYQPYHDKNAVPFGNEVRYTASYSGPERCKKEVCRSYDVYFGTSEVKLSARR